MQQKWLIKLELKTLKTR